MSRFRYDALRNRAQHLLARREVLTQQLQQLSHDQEARRIQLQLHVDAIPIMLRIGQLHRSMRIQQIESMVTVALQAVFQTPFEFKLKETEKRGQTEISPIVVLNGHELDPVNSMGGGLVDVISIALRVVLWSMMKDRTDAVIIQDEPARQINSEDFLRNFAELMRELSKSLGIQFITVTCRPGLTHASDRVFDVKLKGESSIVEQRDQ